VYIQLLKLKEKNGFLSMFFCLSVYSTSNSANKRLIRPFLCVFHTVLFKFTSSYRYSFIFSVSAIFVLACLFHRLTRTASLYNGCLAWYNVVLTSRAHSSVKYSHSCVLVRRWNKCVKPLPVVVNVR